MTMRRNVSATVLLVAALTVGLTGCSSGTKIVRTSSQMCRAQGGAYNSDTRQCTFTASSVPGQQACENLGGNYVADLQRCEFDD